MGLAAIKIINDGCWRGCFSTNVAPEMKRALAFIVLGLLVIVVAIAAAAWLKVAVAKLDVAGAREL